MNTFVSVVDSKIIINDENETFVLCTFPFVAMTWNKAMKFAKQRNCLVPTIKQLTLIFKHKNKINDCLESLGQEKIIENEWFWTSEELCSSCSYYVGFNSGYSYPQSKNYPCYVQFIKNIKQ